MAIDWQQQFNDLVTQLLSSWPPTTGTIEQDAEAFVAKLISGNNQDVADAIVSALQSGKVSQKNIIGLLATYVSGWIKNPLIGNQYIQQLLTDLKTGTISTSQIATIAGEWVASRTSDTNLQQLIEATAAGNLNLNAVETALIGWLNRIGKNQLGTDLQALIDGDISFQDVLLMIVAYLVNDSSISKPGTTIEKWTQAVVHAFGKAGNTPLVQVLQNIVDKQYVDAIILVLKDLGIAADPALISAFLSGNLEQIGVEYLSAVLTRSIAGVTADQASALAKSIVGILTGKVQLIPQQTEQEQLDMTDAQYAIWLRLRKLVYACKLALASGPIVPADALAQPHVFAAAALQTTTKLNSLASAKQLAQLLTYIWNFTRVEFGGDPHGDKYIQYPPISLAAVQAGADLFDLYLSIYITMFPVGRR